MSFWLNECRSKNKSLNSRARDFGRDNLGLRDGSEMVVADVCVKGIIHSQRNWERERERERFY